jgi:hypothetical protein
MRVGVFAIVLCASLFSGAVLAKGDIRVRIITPEARLYTSADREGKVERVVKAGDSFVSVTDHKDFYLVKDDHSGMSPAAKRGVALFFSDRLKCSECHGSVNMSGPTLFTGAMPSDPAAFFHDTGVAAEPAQFRAPTLRNIAVTAPYMHDGSIATLKDVIAHYAAGGRHKRAKSDKVRGFAISPAEIDDLVAFLESLTDQRFLTNPALSNPLSNPDLRREENRRVRTNSEPPAWLTGSH